MLKFIATDVVVSRGFKDNPALRYSEDGSSVRFRIGKRVYDKREKDNYRWININMKAFGALCERIKKMNLDEGSYVHVEGRFDEDVWDDNGKTMRAPVVILTDIERTYSGNGNSKADGNGEGTPANEPVAAAPNDSASQSEQQAPASSSEQQQMPGNFTGYEAFGGPNPFFPQE